MGTTKQTVRIAAMADTHLAASSEQSLYTLFAEIGANADILVVCGDLTNLGLADEASFFVKQLKESLSIPVVAVLGNHDYESGKQEEVREILVHGGIKLLDGEACEIQGIGFAGAKGFAGGFGHHSLEPWGEPIIKEFVRDTLNEALKLESALARLRTKHRIALLHYSPIQATVEGEPLEIYPFLGSARLEEPLNRFAVTAVFHGHAHRGFPEGRTSSGVPVYNVSMSLLRRAFPDRAPYRIVELAVPVANDDDAAFAQRVQQQLTRD
jgi:Icc-related predicted phosphoesterase